SGNGSNLMVPDLTLHDRAVTLVDSLADEGVRVGDFEHAFGMPDEQDVLRPLQAREPLEQAALRFLVEVNHNIAAEDDIQRAAHGQLMHQVELLEGDQA